MVAQLARNPPNQNEHRNTQNFEMLRNPPISDHSRSQSTPHPVERNAQSPHYREKISPQYHEPRLVYPVMKKSGDLGVRLVGGNAVGIFIHSVDIDSPAYNIGLRCADQILEYNGTDLRHATAEQAAYELAKPVENVSILAQYCPEKYNLAKDQPGDSYYVKAMFDRYSSWTSFKALFDLPTTDESSDLYLLFVLL